MDEKKPIQPITGTAGRKDDSGKVRYDLVPELAEAELAEVITFGASKYGADNWRAVPDPDRRYYAAARRHLAAWRAGEVADPETGRHPLAHAVCCLFFLMERDLERAASGDGKKTA